MTGPSGDIFAGGNSVNIHQIVLLASKYCIGAGQGTRVNWTGPSRAICGRDFGPRKLCQIKAIQVHHFCPGGNKIADELFLRVSTGIHFRNGAQLRI